MLIAAISRSRGRADVGEGSIDHCSCERFRMRRLKESAPAFEILRTKPLAQQGATYLLSRLEQTDAELPLFAWRKTACFPEIAADLEKIIGSWGGNWDRRDLRRRR